MSRARVTLSKEAERQARELQQQHLTFSEALMAMCWFLSEEPLRGEPTVQGDIYALERGPAPGSPGMRVTYRYRPGEVVIVAVEALR